MTMQDIIIGTKRTSVGELIGKGGEGEVFTVNGRIDHAVKIYNTGLRAKREDKVRAMVRGGLAAKTNLVAYPIEIVFNRRGNFLGFLMRLLSGFRPVHEVYSPKSRKRYFTKADYRFVIRAALNSARAVGKVHQTGCVIGDLNHSGVLVSQDATVALIDADSFQFRQGGKIYRCLVGVPDFTPPELYGQNLEAVVRTIEHDNFSLAVAIFQLLFMGRHPYAGQYNGPYTSMGEAIAQNRFAFSLTRRSATMTNPPPGSLTLDLFPALVSDAFEQAFGLNPAARPSASDWIVALTRLEGSLRRCSKVRTHYYPNNAKNCVWCELVGKSGVDMFPDLSTVATNIPSDSRRTEQAIREILAFRFPTMADMLLQPSTSVSRGSSALREAKSKKRGRSFMGLLMMAGAVTGFIFAISLWFIWLALGVWGLALVSDRKVEDRPFLDAFQKADERVQRELDAFIRHNGLTEVFKVRGDLDGAIASYKSIDDDLEREVTKLNSTRKVRQLTSYLDNFSVLNASISGIGPSRKATLISFGIETAADVNRSAVLQVPGFGEVMTGRLMDWRRGHESRFRYNRTPNAQDIAEERALRAKFAGQKAKLESIIRNGLATLRTVRSKLEMLPDKARSDPVLMKALKKRAVAEKDLKILGASIPKSTVGLSIISPPQQSVKSKRGVRPTPMPSLRATGVHRVPNCPRCGSPMRRRSGKYGQFWGCSRYPSCRGTRNI
jgi:DNA-binding helix-hairpin-helix protein with protein kinase domain